MRESYILFDSPADYPPETEYHHLGSSPKFAGFLKDYLLKNAQSISSVNLALYLFNNFGLHQTFRRLAEAGIKINIVSIPLEGYDDRLPKLIQNPEGVAELAKPHTKKSLAEIIYNSFVENPAPGYSLRIFSHTYIRSPKIKPFSRGQTPYSLHTKSLLIEFKNGKTLSGISSSNFALRDQIKHDVFVLYEAGKEEAESAKTFFAHLAEASHLINDVGKTEPYQSFKAENPGNAKNQGSMFFAPFYADSPVKAEETITRLFLSAQKRIWIMAQHISSFNYTVPLKFRVKVNTSAVQKKSGCLGALIQKGKEGIEVKCLSQTYFDASHPSEGFRMPVNTYNFGQFIREFRKLPNAGYAVNCNAHSKYIVVDDTVLATTFNYTPSQFIYLPYVNIARFENIPGLSFQGVYSEVGHMVKLDRKNEVECFVKNFGYVWADKLTKVTIQAKGNPD